jgi:hypothetical protein
MHRTAAEEVRLVAYFGKTPDPTPSAKSRYEWELAGDDALTPAAEAALVDTLRKRIFGQRTVGLVVRIPLFGKSPVSFSGVTLQDLPKKLQGEVASVVAPSDGSRTVSHPNPTNHPEPPRGTMLREFSTPAPDPDSLTARTTKLAASLPHGSPLRRLLVATVKAACPGHLGNPMQVPPQLSRASAPGVSCGSCTYFCPTRNVCKAFGDYPVSADMVCAAWQAEGEGEAPEFGLLIASTGKVAKGTPRSMLEQNPTAQVEVMPDAGITVIRYNGAKTGKPAAAVYSGKSENPLWDYYFGSESAREQYIAAQLEKSKAAMAVRQERAQAKRDFQHGMKDGDILYSSWGYDQTNIDFYEVVGVVGKQVLIREVETKVVRRGHGADSVVPVPGRYIGAVLKKIPQKGYRGEPYVKVSDSQSAYPWDGKPKDRTAPGWGH